MIYFCVYACVQITLVVFMDMCTNHISRFRSMEKITHSLKIRFRFTFIMCVRIQEFKCARERQNNMKIYAAIATKRTLHRKFFQDHAKNKQTNTYAHTQHKRNKNFWSQFSHYCFLF